MHQNRSALRARQKQHLASVNIIYPALVQMRFHVCTVSPHGVGSVLAHDAAELAAVAEIAQIPRCFSDFQLALQLHHRLP
jgi:hypothetical protein